MPAAAVIASVREFFLLDGSSRTVAAYTRDQHERVVGFRRAGEARLRASHRARSQAVSCLLLREAIVAFARMHVAAGDATTKAESPTEYVEAVPFDYIELPAENEAQVRRLLADGDAVDLDAMDPIALDALERDLELVAQEVSRGVEARTFTQLRAQRWARWAAVAVVALWGAWLAARAYLLPVNVAVGKPVHVSSYKQNPPDGHELVDGRPGYTFGVHTDTQDNPNVVIDLLHAYAVDRIVVYNRADGWWDDCLPLVVETSTDGTTYTELERREQHFGFDVPWKITTSGKMMRYVRLRVARRSYLTLGKVEVFGRLP